MREGWVVDGHSWPADVDQQARERVHCLAWRINGAQFEWCPEPIAYQAKGFLLTQDGEPRQVMRYCLRHLSHHPDQIRLVKTLLIEQMQSGSNEEEHIWLQVYQGRRGHWYSQLAIIAHEYLGAGETQPYAYNTIRRGPYRFAQEALEQARAGWCAHHLTFWGEQKHSPEIVEMDRTDKYVVNLLLWQDQRERWLTILQKTFLQGQDQPIALTCCGERSRSFTSYREAKSRSKQQCLAMGFRWWGREVALEEYKQQRYHSLLFLGELEASAAQVWIKKYLNQAEPVMQDSAILLDTDPVYQAELTFRTNEALSDYDWAMISEATNPGKILANFIV